MTKRIKKTVAEFEQAHGQSKIKAMQRQLEAEHAKVEALAGVQNKVVVERSSACKIKFAVTADRHIGSLYHHADALRAFCDYAGDEGASCILDAGDMLDGHRIYKGQEFELRDIGLEAQLDRFADNAPDSIPVRFVTGNHDGSFKQAAGVPVGKLIAGAAKNYQFLGEDQGRVAFKTPNGEYVVALLHPGGGCAYSLSYRPQKIVEAIEGGNKPNMLVIGHYHKAEWMPSYRNVSVIQAGTFQKQTPFMARGGLAAHVGGWIVSVVVGTTHNVVKAEFVAFYV